jgi:uncharacterized protein
MGRISQLDIFVERYINDILPKIKEKLNPKSVIIFGSRSRNEGSDESDLDVLIVSDFFAGKRFLGRIPMMLRMFRFQCPTDYLCYSPEEFEIIKSTSIVVEEALNKGIRVI